MLSLFETLILLKYENFKQGYRFWIFSCSAPPLTKLATLLLLAVIAGLVATLMAAPVMAGDGNHFGTSTYHTCRALADWDPEPGWSWGTPKCKRSTTAADDPNIENKRCYCYQYGQTDAQSFTVLRSGIYNAAGNKRMQNTCWSKRNGSIICENPH